MCAYLFNTICTDGSCCRIVTHLAFDEFATLDTRVVPHHVTIERIVESAIAYCRAACSMRISCDNSCDIEIKRACRDPRFFTACF